MKRRGLQVLGVLAVVLGGTIGLLFIRAVITGRVTNISKLVADLLFAAIAAYLIYNGIRLVSMGEGMPRPKTRFGWDKMLIGFWIFYVTVGEYFHLSPSGPIKPLEPSNATQASAMHVTQFAILIVGVFLIVSGTRQGSRKNRADATSVAVQPNT